MVARKKVITSLIYKFLERCGTQGVSFVVSIILARILEPHNFGVVSILLIFTNIATVFVNAGLNTALIQKEDTDEVDYSTVFFASMGIAVLAYIALFFAAPYISVFYKMPELTNTLRILAIILFFNSAASVQSTKAIKELQFRRIMIVSIFTTVVSGGVGVVLAYSGFGVWALVGQQIVSGVMNCVSLWIAFGWRPRAVFSIEKFKSLFSYGWKMLASGLLNTIYNNLQGLIIGKKYTTDTLAYYDRGSRYPGLGVEILNGSIQTVLLPVFSQAQRDRVLLKKMVRRSVVMSSFLVFPAMAGLAATAKPLVVLFLTEKWLPAVPFLMLSCFINAFLPLNTANLNAISALGRSDIFLKLEIIKKCYGLIVLAITVFCFDSALAIIVGSCICTPLSIVINAFPNKKLLDYSVKEQISDILPSLLLSGVMGAIVWSIILLGWNDWLTLIIQITLGVILYVFGAWVLKLEGMTYLLGFVKKRDTKI